jgi:hypothetical protein
MKAHDLAKILLDGKDVEVMFQDPNSDGGPFSVGVIGFKVATKNEFPKDFGMSKGFEYILMEN